MNKETSERVQKRNKDLAKFVGTREKELVASKHMRPVLELFSPFNSQIVTDPYIAVLLQAGGMDEALPLGTWKVGENRTLVVEPDHMPPMGTLDGEEWIGVKDLKKKLGIIEEEN